MDYGRALKAELLMEHRPDNWVPYAQPLLDAVCLFEELGIGYAVIGGVAAMYYGRPRFTEDVDFVATTGHMAALAANPAIFEKYHFDLNHTLKLYLRTGVSVDLWKDEYADQIVQRGIDVSVSDRIVKMIEPHDLIAMKLRGGRLKDDYDVGEIIMAIAIDLGRLRSLVTGAQMQRFDEIRRRAVPPQAGV